MSIDEWEPRVKKLLIVNSMKQQQAGGDWKVIVKQMIQEPSISTF